MDTPQSDHSAKSSSAISISRLAELSVFFPCYNEEENIEPLLKQALEIFPRYAAKVEIIVIDDGSTDRTRELAEQWSAKHPEIRVVSQANGGYGAALQTGFMSCRYAHVFFSDADLQFDLSEFEKLVPHADADFVIGYRLTRADGFKRVVTMKMLKIWSWIFLGYPLSIRDTNCAFKLIKRESLMRLMPLFSSSMMITTELLLRAHRAKMKIVQIGVHHFDRVHGLPTGQNPKVILKAVRETFMLQKKLRAVAAAAAARPMYSVQHPAIRDPRLKANEP